MDDKPEASLTAGQVRLSGVGVGGGGGGGGGGGVFNSNLSSEWIGSHQTKLEGNLKET